jgi:HAMP domain-containing protein
MGGLRTNLIMIAVALAVLAALLFARRELTRALSESQPAAQTTP